MRPCKVRQQDTVLAGPKRMADESVPDGTKCRVIKHTVMLTVCPIKIAGKTMLCSRQPTRVYVKTIKSAAVMSKNQ